MRLTNVLCFRSAMQNISNRKEVEDRPLSDTSQSQRSKSRKPMTDNVNRLREINKNTGIIVRNCIYYSIETAKLSRK